MDFYNAYSSADDGTWIRVTGHVSSATGRTLSITYGLPAGLTTRMMFDMESAESSKDVKVNDAIIIVGQVVGKTAGIISIDHCIIESIGEAAQKAYNKQAKARIQRMADNAISVTAKQLCKDYSDNEVNADNIYRKKAIAVTGSISSIGKDILDNPYVVLSDGTEYSFSGVSCYFTNTEQLQLIAALAKGMKITIVGTCDGESLGSPILNECYIVQ